MCVLRSCKRSLMRLSDVPLKASSPLMQTLAHASQWCALRTLCQGCGASGDLSKIQSIRKRKRANSAFDTSTLSTSKKKASGWYSRRGDFSDVAEVQSDDEFSDYDGECKSHDACEYLRIVDSKHCVNSDTLLFLHKPGQMIHLGSRLSVVWIQQNKPFTPSVSHPQSTSPKNTIGIFQICTVLVMGIRSSNYGLGKQVKHCTKWLYLNVGGLIWHDTTPQVTTSKVIVLFRLSTILVGWEMWQHKRQLNCRIGTTA